MNTRISKENKVRKDTLIQALTALGYKQDRWGHMQKETVFNRGKDEEKEGFFRVKFQAISVRLEMKIKGSDMWHKISSDYLVNVQILDNGSILIGNKRLRSKQEIEESRV
jgi:hypothetical protein